MDLPGNQPDESLQPRVITSPPPPRARPALRRLQPWPTATLLLSHLHRTRPPPDRGSGRILDVPPAFPDRSRSVLCKAPPDQPMHTTFYIRGERKLSQQNRRAGRAALRRLQQSEIGSSNKNHLSQHSRADVRVRCAMTRLACNRPLLRSVFAKAVVPCTPSTPHALPASTYALAPCSPLRLRSLAQRHDLLR